MSSNKIDIMSRKTIHTKIFDDLTDEQNYLVNYITREISSGNRQKVSYSGKAGTGKTTVVKRIIQCLGLEPDEVLAMAYTGKAVMVLAMQNLNCATIHSTIYNPIVCVAKDEDGNPIIKPNGEFKKEFKFVLKEKLASSRLKLLIVDEATMVNDSLVEEILSFGLPTIFIGDNNQLPPVFGKSSIMDMPDFTLTKIMRQAEDSPIITLANRVLNGIPLIIGEYGTSRVIDKLDLGENLIRDYDMILCGKNKTRDLFNNHIREKVLGIPDKRPVIGDRVVCRANNWERHVNGFYLVNGMFGYLTDIDYEHYNGKKLYVDFKPEFLNDEFLRLEMDNKYIQKPYDERKDYGLSNLCKFEYGYTSSVHLSQGSQYNSILFYDEKFGDEEFIKRLRYTAITRAVDRVTILQSKPNYSYYDNTQRLTA